MSMNMLQREPRDRIFRSFDEANYFYRDRLVRRIQDELGKAAQNGDEKAEVDLYKSLYDAIAVELPEKDQHSFFDECFRPLKDVLDSKDGRGHAAQVLGDHCFKMHWEGAEELYREALVLGTEDVLDNNAVLASYPALIYHWLDIQINGAPPSDRVRAFVADHVIELLEHEFQNVEGGYASVGPQDKKLVDEAVAEWRAAAESTLPARLLCRARMLALCQWIAVNQKQSLDLHRALLMATPHSECAVPFLLYANRVAEDERCGVLRKWLPVLLGCSSDDWDVWVGTRDAARLGALVLDACGR